MTTSASILVADDDDVSARFLNRLLTREGHHVSVVRSADEVLAACAAQSPDIVLLDFVAPRGHGFDICRRLKEQASTRFVPVVIVTAQSERDDRLKGIMAGADDFLGKPFDPLELHARIQSLVRLKRYTDELESAETIILGMGATIEARDPLTQGHCQRLAAYATRMGRALGLDAADLAALERGGFLHDIGKVAVPDSVLLKGGKLDPQESRVMREHPDRRRRDLYGAAVAAEGAAHRPASSRTPRRHRLSRWAEERASAAARADRRHRRRVRRAHVGPAVPHRRVAG